MTEEFLSIENFKLAVQRLKTAPRREYKDFYYPDLKAFEVFLDKNCETVIESIRNNIYEPTSCHKIYLPKKGNFIRPLSLLNFIDLVVYQAIANVIADNVYDQISPLYNKTVFGNQVYRSSDIANNKFFFRNWKSRWKKFNERTGKYYDDGFGYLMEFDLASFFDTIDHNVLIEIFRREFGIDNSVLELLKMCLHEWTDDSNITKFKTSKGIPQGPIASGFFADLFLIYLDRQFLSLRSLKVKYLRYVDDIRIFSKNEETANRAIATLDLISRDLGLIPQASKVKVKKIDDKTIIGPYLRSGFSAIAKEYVAKEKSLKSKTHRKLKKTFKLVFDPENEQYLDKTILRFSLYKLNQDDEVKKLLIDNFQLIQSHSAAIFYYLSRYYKEDTEVLQFVSALTNNELSVFHQVIALGYKYFPNLPFDPKKWTNFFTRYPRSWTVRYYMIDWAEYHGKKELIFQCNGQSYFVQRKVEEAKFRMTSDRSVRTILASNLIAKQDVMTSLHGLSYIFYGILFFPTSEMSATNNYTKSILTNNRADYINYTLQIEYGIENSNAFFNNAIWSNDDEYRELSNVFLAYNQTHTIDPSTATIQLNFFNNLVYDKLCQDMGIALNSSDYGVNLNAGYLTEELPFTNQYWAEINAKRNQNTDAHPYDRYGNLRVKINSDEMIELHEKFIKTLDEIVQRYNENE